MAVVRVLPEGLMENGKVVLMKTEDALGAYQNENNLRLMLNIMVEAIIKRNLSVQIITGYRSWPN
jgi:hypothetical protein